MKRLHHNRNYFSSQLILPLLLVLLIAGPVRSYGSTLQPEAEVNYERGIAAAEQGEWKLAVEYFLNPKINRLILNRWIVVLQDFFYFF